MAAATMASSRPSSMRNLMGGYSEEEYVEEVVVDDDEYYEEIIVEDDDGEYLEIVIDDDDDDFPPTKAASSKGSNISSCTTDVALLNGRATQKQVDGLSFAEAKKFLLGLPNKQDTAKQAMEFDYNSDEDSVYEEYVLPDEITAIRQSRRRSIFAAPDLDQIEEASEHDTKSIGSFRSRSSLNSPISTREDRKLSSLDAIQEQHTPGNDAENNGVPKTPKKTLTIPEHINISLDDSPNKAKETSTLVDAGKKEGRSAKEEEKEERLPEGTILSGALNDTNEKHNIRVVRPGKMIQSPSQPKPRSCKSVGSDCTQSTAGTSSSSLENLPISPVPEPANPNRQQRRGSRKTHRSSSGPLQESASDNKPSSSSSLKSRENGDNSNDDNRSTGSSKGHPRRRGSMGRRGSSHRTKNGQQQSTGESTKPPGQPPLTMEDEIMELLSNHDPATPPPPPPPSDDLHGSTSSFHDDGGSSSSLQIGDLGLMKSPSAPRHKSAPALPPFNPNSPIKRPQRRVQRSSLTSPTPSGEENSLGQFFSNAPSPRKIDRDCRSAYSSSRRSSRSGVRRSGTKPAAPLFTKDGQPTTNKRHRSTRRSSIGGSSGSSGSEQKHEIPSVCGTTRTTTTTPSADQRQESSPHNDSASSTNQRQESSSHNDSAASSNKNDAEKETGSVAAPPPAPMTNISIPSPQSEVEQRHASPEKSKKAELDMFLSKMSDKPANRKVDRDAQSTYSGVLGGRRRRGRGTNGGGGGGGGGDGDCRSVVSSATSARRRSSSTVGRGRGRARNKSMAKDAKDDQSVASMPALASKARRARSASVGRKNRLRRNRRKELEDAKEKWNEIAAESLSDKDEHGFPRADADADAGTNNSQTGSPPRSSNNIKNEDKDKAKAKPRDMGAALEKISRRSRSGGSSEGGERHGSVTGSARSVGSGSQPTGSTRSVGSGSRGDESDIGRNSARSIRKGERRPPSNRSTRSRNHEDDGEIGDGSQSSLGTLRKSRSNSRDRSKEKDQEGQNHEDDSDFGNGSQSSLGRLRKPRSNSSRGDRSQEQEGQLHEGESEIGSGSQSSRGVLRKPRSNSRDKSTEQQQEGGRQTSQRSTGSDSQDDISSTGGGNFRSSAEVAAMRREKSRNPNSGRRKYIPSSMMSPTSRKRQTVKRNHSADDIVLAPELEDVDGETSESPKSPPRPTPNGVANMVSPRSAARDRRAPGRSQSSHSSQSQSQVQVSSQALYKSPRTPQRKPPQQSERTPERSPPSRSQSEHLSPRHTPGSGGGPASPIKATKSMPRHSMSSRMSSAQAAAAAARESELHPPLSPNKEERDYLRKKDELEYKMQLFREYRRLSKEEGMSDDDILSVFPEMKVVMKRHQPDA